MENSVSCHLPQTNVRAMLLVIFLELTEGTITLKGRSDALHRPVVGATDGHFPPTPVPRDGVAGSVYKAHACFSRQTLESADSPGRVVLDQGPASCSQQRPGPERAPSLTAERVSEAATLSRV